MDINDTGPGLVEMSLRDHFAAEAMNGILSCKKEMQAVYDRFLANDIRFPDVLADHAYLIANAMMDRRVRR